MILPTQRQQILLVEDNAEIRRSLARALEMEKYTVHQAEHGQAALKCLEQVTPDLILSDINMPKMDGIMLYVTVRKNPGWTAIPFIFLTANDAPEDIQAGRSLGVEDYLTKPIRQEDLVAIVNARLLRVSEVKLAQVNRAYLETVNVLANTIEGRDPFTGGHVERVASYAMRLAQALRWPEEHLLTLEFGARLHDIGKIVVPDQVLKKAGPLTKEEWELMKQHPVAGGKILRSISHLQGTLPYVLYHHEHWNGQGYPFGLKGKDIPIEGRLLAVVDVYDALTSLRPYHPARPKAEVLQFLQLKAGVQFDPDLVAVFLKIMADEQ